MECNTVTFLAADGKSESFPLDALIERGAVIASKVNSEDIAESMGAFNQLWVPGLPAKFYLQNIVSITFERRENPPAFDMADYAPDEDANRPNISLTAPRTCAAGETIRFEGYADDYDRAIVAVQLSLDQGGTWTTLPVGDAVPEKWVYWCFDYTPEQAGSYQCRARAVNEDGKVSPIAAAHSFEVVEE